MRGILIAAALVVVIAGAGVAGYAATKDDDGSGGGLSSRDLLSGSQPAPSSPNPPSPDSSVTPTGSTEAPSTSPAPPPADSSTSPDAPAPPTDTSPASPPTPSRGSSKSGVVTVPPARVFSGTGNKRLGTVDLRATSILRWRAKGHFEVRFGQQDFSIIAPTKSGQLVVPAFRFDHVRVVARGRWRITVSPQK